MQKATTKPPYNLQSINKRPKPHFASLKAAWDTSKPGADFLSTFYCVQLHRAGFT